MTRTLALASLLLAPSAAFAGPGAFSDTDFLLQLDTVRAVVASAAAEPEAASWDGVPMIAAADAGPVDPARPMVKELLKGSGIPESYVDAAFDDPRVQNHEEIPAIFDRPHESLTYEQYRKLLITETRIAAGVKFYKERKDLLGQASARYGADPLIMASIVGVESSFGAARGKYRVFNALVTQVRLMPRRQKWAAKELAELLKSAYGDRLDPHEVWGSYAGAFGYGQLMPSSWNNLAVDFDGDKVRSPYQWPDALGSIGNYLARSGYPAGSADFSRDSRIWKAIYAYNHSDNYVNVIIDLRAEILARLNPSRS